MLPRSGQAARARRLYVPYQTRRLLFRRARPENTQRVHFTVKAGPKPSFWISLVFAVYCAGKVADRWLKEREKRKAQEREFLVKEFEPRRAERRKNLGEQRIAQHEELVERGEVPWARSKRILLTWDGKPEEGEEGKEEPGARGQRDAQQTTEETTTTEEESACNPYGSFRFIPLGFVRRIPGDFYSENDPEWQLFVAASQQREYINSIKRSLVATVVKYLASHKEIRSVIGTPKKSPIGAWLTHDFPNRAPPQYVRSGLVIGNGYVAWAEKSVPYKVGDSIRNVFQAFPVFPALYVASSIFLELKLDKIRAYFGYEPTPANRQNAEPLPETNNRPAPETSKSTPASSEPSPSSPTRENLAKTKLPLQRNQANASVYEDDADGMERLTDMQKASLAFLGVLFQAEKRFKPPPSIPRTCFRVQGVVRLDGSDGHTSVWVTAHFDLEAREFASINVDIKNVTPHTLKVVKR